MTRFALLAALAASAASSAMGTPKHGASPSFQDNCNALASKVKIDNVHIDAITYIPIGGNFTANIVPTCVADGVSLELGPSGSPFEFCRVALNITTSPRSQVYMEAWLPSNYSGRFLATGDGGLGGCVIYPDLHYGASFGFATIGTNNGHDGDTGQYFYRNPDTLEDFAYRALHNATAVGKQIVRQFYEQGFAKSYYLGSSTGGRMGWKSIQAFPDDFDGVVAGCPAINLVNLISWAGRFLVATGDATAERFISVAQWTLIHNEILRQCDGLDGAVDGTIEDPDLCQPIFETLACLPASAPGSCLTPVQLETVNTVFSPLYGLNATLLYPRMQPGSELTAALAYYSGVPVPFTQDWYRYVVLNDPAWDPATLTAADVAKADAQDPFDISSYDSDISAFQKKGGKVIHYHGLEDPIISSESSKLYYKNTVAAMAQAPAELDDFYRFFQISGMGHCEGGSGASNIGQGLNTVPPPEVDNNVLLSLVRWVEEGVAPEFIRGTKYADNSTAAAYTRKHCKYPKRNKYVGPGPAEDEDAWQCV